MAELRELIVGDVGSPVTLLIGRRDRLTETTFEVRLVRGVARYSENGDRSERSLSPVSMRSNASTTFVSPHSAGVGILFRQGSNGKIIVSSCPHDGPAGILDFF